MTEQFFIYFSTENFENKKSRPYPSKHNRPYRRMDTQTPTIHELTTLYTENRYKAILQQTKAFQLLENSRKEVNNILKSSSMLISDLAKRLYINQLKLNEYATSLAKYQDVNLIENKYQKLPELEDSVLYQLVVNAAQTNQSFAAPFIENTSSSFPYLNFDMYSQNLLEAESIQDFNIKIETSPQQQNQFLRNSYVPFQDTIKQKTKQVQPKINQKTKKQNYFATLSNGMLLQNMKKKSKGYQILAQPKLEMPNKYTLLPSSEIKLKKQAISLDKDINQEKQKRQEQTEKQERRHRIKQQSESVARFVHSYLAIHLKYTNDHKNYIPKKSILNLYLNWCKAIQKRKILFPSEMNIIQMFLTNQLKVAFSRIDVYSNNYKGLFFKDMANSFITLSMEKTKKRSPISIQQAKTVDVENQLEEIQFQTQE